MARIPHSWREAYSLALRETDRTKLIGRIEYAIIAIERRYADWGTDPGTPAELTAIQKCISALQRLTKQCQLRQGAVLSAKSGGSSNATEHTAERATRTLFVLPSTTPPAHQASLLKPTE